jgi:hypothetical protein
MKARLVAEFVPHDSPPRFGSLDHTSGGIIDGEPAFAESPPNRTCGGYDGIDQNDPNVWSGRALQEVFVELSSAVLHQCIRPLIGAVLLRAIGAGLAA